MPVNHTYEYAVIRVVPRVEREEFINAGIIVFCKSLDYLEVGISLDSELLTIMSPGIDVSEVQLHLDAIGKIAHGDKDGGPIACLDKAMRFRWLTAVRSTVVQCSRVHPGLTTNPGVTLSTLFDQLVSRSL